MATQSSNYSNSVTAPWAASNANDGNYDNSRDPGVCAVTHNTPPVWWQVDLLEVHEITKVAITERLRNRKSFFFNFWRTHVLFVGPLISLFWTSDDICPGFQSQGGYCLHAFLPARYSSDSPLAGIVFPLQR